MRRAVAWVAAVGIFLFACGAEAGRTTGPRIAFQRFYKAISHIFTVLPDGTGMQRVSHATGRSENPEFSRDGTLLVYERSFSIYVSDFDGTDRRLVVRNGYEPKWSPDGTKLLFTRYRVDNDVAIFSIKADGSGHRELGKNERELQHHPLEDGFIPINRAGAVPETYPGRDTQRFKEEGDL